MNAKTFENAACRSFILLDINFLSFFFSEIQKVGINSWCRALAVLIVYKASGRLYALYLNAVVMIMARNIQIFRKTSKNHISSATEWCKLSNFFGTRCELVICRDNLYSVINISKWPQSRFKLHWQTLVHTAKMQGFDVDDSKKVVWKCNFAFLHHFSIIPIHYAGKMYSNHHGVILEPVPLR